MGKLPKLTKRVSPGERCPKWMGVYYFDYMTHQAVCTYMPFNRILRPIRSIYLWILCFFKCPKADWIDKIVSKEKKESYDTGYQTGFHQGLLEGAAHMRQIRQLLTMLPRTEEEAAHLKKSMIELTSPMQIISIEKEAYRNPNEPL